MERFSRILLKSSDIFRALGVSSTVDATTPIPWNPYGTAPTPFVRYIFLIDHTGLV